MRKNGDAYPILPFGMMKGARKKTEIEKSLIQLEDYNVL